MTAKDFARRLLEDNGGDVPPSKDTPRPLADAIQTALADTSDDASLAAELQRILVVWKSGQPSPEPAAESYRRRMRESRLPKSGKEMAKAILD